jgi:hypothetical protein
MSNRKRGYQPSNNSQQQSLTQSPLNGPKSKTDVGHDANDCRNNDSRTKDEGAASKLARKFKWFDPQVINAVLAITGICVLISNIGQLDVMRGTLGEMKRSFRQGNRAYLGAQDTILWVLTKNEKGESRWQKIEAAGGQLTRFYSFEVILRNSGTTPAIGVDGAYTVELRSDLPSDNTVPPEVRKIGQSSRDVPKDAIITYDVPGWNEGGRQLRPEDVNDINAGRVFLVIRGAVTYKDIFGDLRKTTTCGYYDPSNGDIVACPGNNIMK